MSTYLKNMAGYKHSQLKSKSYDEIKKLFDKEMKRVNTFVDMNSEVVKGKMKRHIEIVKDDEVAIDAIPLATKPLVIIEYQIDKDGRMGYFKLIRADGSSKRYSSMIKILQGIDREDLETLWKLVKAKHGNTRPEEDYDRLLWGDLKLQLLEGLMLSKMRSKTYQRRDKGVLQQERTVVTFGALWRPVLALEAWTGRVDTRMADMSRAEYDDHRLVHDMLVQHATFQRELQEMRGCVIALE
ncbi:hypothetical protein Tco_0064605 [Tanacetum coccineum]